MMNKSAQSENVKNIHTKRKYFTSLTFKSFLADIDSHDGIFYDCVLSLLCHI